MQSFVENLAVVCFALAVVGLAMAVTLDRRRHRRLFAITCVVTPLALVVLAVLSLAGATEARCETKGGSWVEQASAVVYGTSRPETLTAYGCVYPFVLPATTIAGPQR